MASNEEKNEMLVMVLIDLAGICRKLEDNSAVPAELRSRAGQLVADFEALVPHRGKGAQMHHEQGEELLTKMALLLPRLLEVQAKPAIVEDIA